jgi:3-hydroxy-9,10-secoandrosta-1,3,5(10)-triene-9,17-dione monooxygenase
LNPGPLYRLPFGSVFIRTHSAAVLGASAGFLEAWLAQTPERIVFGQKLGQDPQIQELAAQSAFTVQTMKQRFLADCDLMMEAVRTGQALTLADRAELRYSAVRVAQLASRAVGRLFEAGGGHAIFFDHPLQRRYQDIRAMMGHAGLNPQIAARLCGAAHLGQSVLDLFL